MLIVVVEERKEGPQVWLEYMGSGGGCTLALTIDVNNTIVDYHRKFAIQLSLSPRTFLTGFYQYDRKI